MLSALGKEDFGLYSVVGGLIIFILFIGNTMAVSVQRFYAYAIGQGDPEEVKRWFNCAIILHLAFAFILILIGIPVGNFLLDYVMQVSPGRLEICHWVYYLSILGAVGTMVTVPYLAMFYAKQRIFELSLWQTLQAALMFGLAWYLAIAQMGDLLLYYALGMVGVKLILDAIQIIRALWLFKECRLRQTYWFSKKRTIELTSYTGWTFFGALGGIFKNQGLGFLINVFSGAKVNAAFGIANQVNSQSNVLTQGLLQSLSPEIVSREGAGDRDSMISLSLRSCKFSCFLVLLWIIPIYFELDYLLGIWLVNVPEHTVAFCKIALIAYAVDNYTVGYGIAIRAHGNIAGYQMTQGMLYFLTFPLAWGAYAFGCTPEIAMSSLVITSLLFTFSRALWFKKLLKMPITVWVRNVFIPVSIVSILSFVVCFMLNSILKKGMLNLVILCVASAVFTILISWKLLFDKVERNFILSKLTQLKSKLWK